MKRTFKETMFWMAGFFLLAMVISAIVMAGAFATENEDIGFLSAVFTIMFFFSATLLAIAIRPAYVRQELYPEYPSGDDDEEKRREEERRKRQKEHSDWDSLPHA